MRNWGRIATLAAFATLFTALAPVALAGPPDESGVVERGDAFGGFIYWGDGHLVLTANNLAEVCNDEAPPIVEGTIISPGDGTTQEHLKGRVPVIVFEFPDDDGTAGAGFGWLGENCAMAEDDRPDPVATGEAMLQSKSRTDKMGVTNNHNGVVGQVTTSDGAMAHLNTFAHLTLDENGGLIDLKTLTTHYTG